MQCGFPPYLFQYRSDHRSPVLEPVTTNSLCLLFPKFHTDLAAALGKIGERSSDIGTIKNSNDPNSPRKRLLFVQFVNKGLTVANNLLSGPPPNVTTKDSVSFRDNVAVPDLGSLFINPLAGDLRLAKPDPRIIDLRVLLREGSRNLMEMPEQDLSARACDHGWAFACGGGVRSL